jgi:N-formylmaleamate deformylase
VPERPAVTPGHLEELRVLGAESLRLPGPEGSLHVLDYRGDGPALLVLPGITSPAITWDFLAAELRDLVRMLVVDLRGRGRSDPGTRYRAGDFADDAEAIIDALGLEAPLVLGHSLGARVTAALAARGSRPLAGTILIDPPLTGPHSGPYPTSRESFLAQLHEGYAGTTGDAVRRFYPKWPRSELLLRARWLSTCEEQAVMDTYDEFTREDFFDWWPAVPAPTTFIYGGESPVVTADGVTRVAALNPAAVIHAVDGAGHMVPWDHPTSALALLRSVLGQMTA